MIISFSGPSGSGKSTIIKEIKKSPLFDSKKIILREEDSFSTIKFFNSLLGDNVFLKYKDEKYFKKEYNDIFYYLFSKLTQVVYPVVVYIEFLVDYFRYEIISKETILLVDKFIYDHDVIFKNILRIKYKWVDWLFNHFPKVYLSFLIDINLNNASIDRNKNNIPGKVTSDGVLHKNILTQYSKIAQQHKLIVIDNNGNLKEAVSEVQRYIVNKNKLINAKEISISGLDGAGKTTTANMLVEYADFLSIKSKVVHFVHNNLLYRLLVKMGYYDFNQPKSVLYKRSRAHSAKERINRTSLFMAFLRFFDSYVQYLFFTLTNRSKLIIFDRFFYDYSVSFEYLDIKGRSFFNKLIPDVKNKFLFNIPPMISYRRKPERVKAFFIDCYEIYLKVAKDHDLKIINTDRKSRSEILQELIDNLH